MKQGAAKKNKLWLWLAIALAALLVVAGIVLALVLPGQQGGPQSQGGKAELYWNVDRLLYTQDAEVQGMSTREAAQDGNFYVRFAYEGKQVELQVMDKQLVNVIDNMDVMGLVFDADGVVVDAVAPETIATKLAVDFYVSQIKDGKALINSSIAMNGMEMEIAITEDTGVWDVSPDAELVGQVGQLGLFDRVQVYANGENTVTHVYVTEHPAQAEVFWRVERCFDTTVGKTTRVPDENGVYTMQFSHKGELVDLQCKDAELVNFIDTQAVLQGQFALMFDEEGYIVETVDVGMALRGTLYANDYHVTEVNGDTYTLTRLSAGNEQGTVKTLTLAEGCQIFQVCQFGCYQHTCGEYVDSLQVNDRVNVYCDLDGNAIMIFVTRRTVDSSMYYNFEQKYGGEAKGSTREKQNGYYVFDLLVDGKVETVKTDNKEFADLIDARSNRCCGLELDGDIITRVYDPVCVAGGTALGNKSPLSAMMGSVITVSDPYSGGSWNAVLSENCKIYNAITGVYGKQIGGETDLRVGDSVTSFRNIKDEICMVFVTSRPVEGAKVYYNLERQYNAQEKQTRREPNEEGWYEFLMACEGKQVTVKTQTKALATFIDSQTAPLVGLKVNSNGVVTNAYEVTIALKNAAKTCNYHYVKNLDAKAGTFSTYYIENEQKKDSSIAQQKMAKNCVVYNVSTAVKDFRGEVSQLKNGDQIQGILDVVTGEVIMIFVMNRDPVYGFESYNAHCAHCDKTVTWEPYGGAVIVEEDKHYYACSEYALRQGIIGKEDDGKTYDVVIDLKGKTVRGSGRAFLVYDKLTILDSVGGGKVMGTTPSGDSATNGSSVMVLGGGELNILGGELTLSDKSTLFGRNGGVLFVGENSVANMYGGKISGGVSTERGGNVYVGGTFNMSGGTVTGGTATSGENIFVVSTGTLNISGGTVDGGIYTLTGGKLTLSGAPTVGGSGIKIPGGVKLSVAGLTAGASVVVDGDGVFTETLTDAESYLAYFKPVSDKDSIEVKGNALNYVKYRVNYNGTDNSDLSFTSGTDAQCPVCKETVTWTALTADAAVLSDGHYYLASDITYTGESAYITGPGTGATACVHLNGHNITATAGQVIEGKAGTLNMMGNGTVSGSYNEKRLFGATVNMNGADGTLNLIGGTYTKSEACNVSSVMLIRNGNVNMYSGAEIVGVNDSGKCANVMVFNRSFNMYGGKISGGSGSQLSSSNWSETVSGITNIHGGEILGTVVLTGGENAHGVFTMDGGTIEGYVSVARYVDAAISGGKVDGTVKLESTATNDNSSVTVSGTPVITGNGLVIADGYKITVGKLLTGASIMVSANGVFTDALENANAVVAYFIPAKGTDEIRVVDKALSYVKVQKDLNDVDNSDLSLTSDSKAVCPVCEREVTWTALSADATTLAGGRHYYLASDITYTGETAYITGPTSGATACVHLNGHNITANAHRAIEAKAGTLNIMGNGTVSGSYNENRLFGATVNTSGINGVLNLVGGTYTKAETCTVSPVVLLRNGDVNLYKGAEIYSTVSSNSCANIQVFTNCFNMYGGKISGGSGIQLATSNWSPTVSGKANIHGGEIVGSVVISGGENAHGAFTMDGGSVNGYVDIRRFADVAISGGTFTGTVNIDSAATNDNSFVAFAGAPVISGKLSVPEGYKIVPGELTTGAKIYVAATGAFTDALPNAEDLVSYFKPARAVDEIKVVDNALVYIRNQIDLSAVSNDDLALTDNKAVCPACGDSVTWIKLTDAAITLEDGKHYYLDGDITYAGTDAAYITGPGTGKSACVHLNGHNITATAHRAVEAKEGIVNVMGNGTVSGAYNANRLFGATVNHSGVGGTLNLIGGTYTKAASCNVSPVVLLRGGDVNVYKAEIYSTANSNTCANVQVYTNAFTMYGGKVSGGTGAQIASANWSGSATGKINIHGGEVAGTLLVTGADAVHGKLTVDGGTVTGYVELGRYVDSVISGGTFGGTVTVGSTATNENSSITLSGNVVMSGVGLKLTNGYKITLGALASEASVNIKATGVFTVANENAAQYAPYFHPETGYEVVVESDALLCKAVVTEEPPQDDSDKDPLIQKGKQITEAAKTMTFPADKTDSTQTCPVCAQEVTWKPLSGQLGAVSEAGNYHYYLTQDIDSQYQFITQTAGTVCLHMNGYDVDVASRIFVTGAKLNIMGTGAITCLGTSGTQTGTLTVGNDTTVSLYGCTIASVAQSGTPAIHLVNGDGATVNVYDGTVIGGEKGTCTGANVVVEKGNFNMYGGTVQNGTGMLIENTLRGGNIYMYSGTGFTMHAGTVTGGTAAQGGNLYAYSATVNIHEDAVITGGESTGTGGNMCLTGTTVFTTSGKITGGKTTGSAAHGGNFSIAEGCVLNITGGEITGGIAAGQGGNIRSWNGTITMTDGVISGGDSVANVNDNVWAAGSTTMNMLGGTVKGTDGTTAKGTAIFLSQTATLYLGGDAAVTRDDGVSIGNIYVSNTATQTAALRILNDWTGSASVLWDTNYAGGAAVDADRGSCGALTEGVFTAGGSYAGTLVYERDQTQVVIGEDGTLKIAAAQ